MYFFKLMAHYQWNSRKNDNTHPREAGELNIDKWLESTSQHKHSVKHYSGKSLQKKTLTTSHMREHNAAYAEAQDIINSWLAERQLSEDDDLAIITEESPTAAQRDSHWPDMTEEKPVGYSPGLYEDIETKGESEVVNSILQDMMQKPLTTVTKQPVLSVEYEVKAFPDPRVTMEMRHRRVKENREKLEKERDLKKNEKLLRKKALLEAKEILQQEENEKKLRAKQEEFEIQKEVTRLRKIMHEQKDARDRVEKLRKLREEEVQKANENLVEILDPSTEPSNAKLELENVRKEFQKMIKQQRIDNFAAKLQKKQIRLCFNAWYQIVLDISMKDRKAKVFADWKCIIRAWTIWKMFHRSRIIEREAQAVEYSMRDMHRKMELARSYSQKFLMMRCFRAWRYWTIREAESRHQTKLTVETRNKISSFLDALATRKLLPVAEDNSSAGEKVSESSRLTQNKSTSPKKPISDRKSMSPKNTINKRNNDRSSKTPNTLGLSSRRSVTSARRTSSENDRDMPANAQVQHRLANQQRMLEEQKRQIREQQKMIEDLNKMCKEQKYEKQLKELHKKIEILEKSPPSNSANPNLGITSKAVGCQEGKRNSVSGTAGHDSDLTFMTDSRSSVSSAATTPSNMKKKVATSPAVKGMEDRAKLRAERRAAVEKRKLERMEEIRAKKEAEEAAERKAEEEQKRQRLVEIQQKKQLEKEREAEKLKRIKEAAEKSNTAAAHYRTSLLKCSFKRWQKVLESQSQKYFIACDHYRKCTLRKCLVPWFIFTMEAKHHAEEIADNHRNRALLSCYFFIWKEVGMKREILERETLAFCHIKLKKKCFSQWLTWVTEEKLMYWEKEMKAKEHYERRLKLVTLRGWREFPSVVEEARLREERKAELRRKVAAMLPDYIGYTRLVDDDD